MLDVAIQMRNGADVDHVWMASQWLMPSSILFWLPGPHNFQPACVCK